MSIEEIKEGDCILFENQYGKVNRIKDDNALCRFYGYTKWCPIAELVRSERKLRA
ncbi:MAG: hypothetical protein IJW05_12290 [Lentisphaeria bacterium]|nr:hypothetical protein [Lentisphaeria bacterium]